MNIDYRPNQIGTGVGSCCEIPFPPPSAYEIRTDSFGKLVLWRFFGMTVPAREPIPSIHDCCWTDLLAVDRSRLSTGSGRQFEFSV